MTNPDRVTAAARRALGALTDLIRDHSDPGSEALGARFELEQALLPTPPAASMSVGEAEAALAPLEAAVRADREAQQTGDRAALRDRIATALRKESSRVDDIALANAVLAVLSEPTDQAAVRAAALREAANRIDNEELPDDYVDLFDNGARWAAKLLRRLADEAQGTTCPGFETVPNRCGCPCEGCKHNCAAHEPAGPAAPAKEAPTVTVHAAPNLSPAAAEALDALVDVATAQMASEAQADGEPIVAYRSLGGGILRCLDHVPPEPDTDFVALTAEDLPDGGICTFPVPPCGRDALTVAEQP